MTLKQVPAKKPRVLFIFSTVSHRDPEDWARIQSRFNALEYDCSSVEEFISHLAPGGKYSQIDAIVRTGWLKAGPFATHLLFRGEPLSHYPPSLKLICCSGHGYDAADVPRLTEMGIWYCNTPDTCTEPVANVALHLILNTFRYLTFAEHCVRTNQWLRSRELGMKAVDPSGAILGIVGMGAIGRAIATRANAGFGMAIHYHNRRQLDPPTEQSLGGAVYHSSLESILRVADCICLACPYTPETHHMLSTPQFTLAKAGGMRVVNIARGTLIDEEALIKAMDEGKVVGVGLDVHEKEPVVHPRLMEDPMVTVLPHIGVCSRTSWRNFDRVCFENLEEFFYGSGRPTTPVNEVTGRVEV